nr:hypothetical protein [Tanacetum cinerariifolium]
MGNDKAPGPDGYTVAFFKKDWDIIADDVTSAESLKVLVSPNQSAFVPGRSISNNILLTQELMHNYHLDHGTPRCAFKVDIQKAYDMVDWDFLKVILNGFGFHDRMSTCVIKEALEELKHASGLVPIIPKSTDYFCNVLNHVKRSIMDILPFEEGRLPVKYLVVPLISSRLIFQDCKELVEKVEARIQDWKNKSLSDEGGLGLRRLDCFNKALIVSHLWKLISMKESLWVKWVHAYKLRGRSFWDVPIRGEISWGWRKVLQLRPLIREFVWHNIGNGALTSLWFDRWCPNSPLANTISTRDIHRADLPGLMLSNGGTRLVLLSHSELAWFGKLFGIGMLKSLGPILCGSPRQVWNHMKTYADIASDHVFSHIVADLLPFANRSLVEETIIAFTTNVGAIVTGDLYTRIYFDETCCWTIRGDLVILT